MDKNLSLDRTQSCSTCLNPDRAFIDDRLDANGEVSAVSVGDLGVSLGDRNAPSAADAKFSPTFDEGTHQRFISQQPDYSGFIVGLFRAGRAAVRQAKAGGPPLNPIAMAMPEEASLVDRLLENSDYEAAFKLLYGANIFDDVGAAFTAMTETIAEFERTDLFAPFTSIYDCSLSGSEFTINPETGSPWREPEVPESISFTELEDGRKLDQNEVEVLVCFMRTLTDARYEALIEDKGMECGAWYIGIFAL